MLSFVHAGTRGCENLQVWNWIGTERWLFRESTGDDPMEREQEEEPEQAEEDEKKEAGEGMTLRKRRSKDENTEW